MERSGGHDRALLGPIVALLGLGCGPRVDVPEAGGSGSGSGSTGGDDGTTGDEMPIDAGPRPPLQCEVVEPPNGPTTFGCSDDRLDCGPHGNCEYVGYDAWKNDMPTCRCDTGHTGELCDACEDGYVASGEDCLTPCAAVGLDCVHGTCAGTIDEPYCDCRGATGSTCDVCAPGYREEVANTEGGTTCVPDCGDCGDLLVCSEATEPPSCLCADAYEPEGDGCTWREAFDNPAFDSCDGWTLEVQDLEDPGMVAEIVDGQLHLRTEHRCDRVSATTTVRYPMPATVPNAALRMRALGNEGAIVAVLGPSSEPIVGTGEWVVIEGCLDRHHHGTVSWFALELRSDGGCADPLLQDFWIDDLEIVSSPDCEP